MSVGGVAAEGPSRGSDSCVSAQARLRDVFAFFSNRLGCLGSIGVSIIGTIVLLALMRGCSGGW